MKTSTKRPCQKLWEAGLLTFDEALNEDLHAVCRLAIGGNKMATQHLRLIIAESDYTPDPYDYESRNTYDDCQVLLIG